MDLNSINFKYNLNIIKILTTIIYIYYLITCICLQEVDAIIDKQGATVTAEIHGSIGKEYDVLL